ncbi:SRPBCC domain-containing protein [Brevibacterium sp. W7.2]|uniref:SRPBCC domain-containing protein n=1 Tax=Brevibacterium sp. W7.2 TaxID=2823518 RepID=UPI001BAAA7B8|nr:SRPBCC domain-containing protein [Brevibacterium sp. W7.2]
MAHRTDDEIIAAQPDSVARTLTVDVADGLRHTAQSLTQTFPASLENLWEACTDPERLGKWFAPVAGHFRLGGRYVVEDNAEGTITACEPRESFTLTWESAGDESEVAVRMAKDGHHSRLTLEHRFTAEADADFWTQFGPGAGGVGWDLSFLGLALYLESRSDEPRDAATFDAEPAHDFIRIVSDRWAEASRLAGTPADEARAAAERTTAFYLGEDDS